jgi:nicotinamide mononucleotide transporter
MLIIQWPIRFHLYAIGIACGIWFVLGKLMVANTDAAIPWADAFSTSFSFVATWLETRKVLTGWIYWIGLNAFSVWLYLMRDLESMAVMTLIFAVLSISGFIRWRKEYQSQESELHPLTH